jgi:hypothetical protein
MGDERAQQLSDWARERVASTSDDDERLLVCGRDSELDSASKFDVVRGEKFEEFTSLMQEAGYPIPANVEHVREMWSEFNPRELFLVWVFNADGQDDVDSVWLTHRTPSAAR